MSLPEHLFLCLINMFISKITESGRDSLTSSQLKKYHIKITQGIYNVMKLTSKDPQEKLITLLYVAYVY